jgi:U2 small nuclear ribonucleoprotein B''
MLRIVFKSFGPIVDIIAKNSLKRKGQAFVVFESEKAAVEAAEIINGFTLFGKEMRVSMAKTHSDETVKRKAADMFDEHKRKRLMQKGKLFPMNTPYCQYWLYVDFKRAEEDAKAQANPAVAAEKPRAPKTGAAAVPDEYVRPNKILFLQNIPRDVDADDLTTIFERFAGFKEVRLVSARAVAFAEFETEAHAISAKEATANTPVGAEGKPMKVTYQRQ